MTAQNKVTLTFAGDATSLDRAMKQVQRSGQQADASLSKSSKHMSESLETVGRQAKYTGELLRGVGGAATLMGGEVGAQTQNLILTAAVIKDVGKGAAGIVPKVREAGGVIAALGGTATIAKGGIVALGIAAAGAAFLIGEKLAQAAGVGQGAIDAINTQRMQDEMLAGEKSVYGVVKALDALGHLSPQSGLDSLYGPGGGLQQRASVDDIDGILNGTKNLNGTKIAAKTHIPQGGSSGAGSLGKTVDAAANALKDKLKRWQDIADQFSSVAKGIADSLGPKLVAGIASPLMLAKGTTVLDNLKKQLTDTLHLKSDLAKLSKMGLGNDLLEQLTAGGLDSLPAADELIASGSSGVHAARSTAQQITAAGGSIAGADAARQFADSLKKPIKVELHVGKGGDDVLDKWLQKALKTKGAKFYGLKAA